jgi:NAD(P)-dependent dehydrogenase (short-subunit alcohol dehydrogenase family)
VTAWGTQSIVDQQGRTFVVTGANSGLGAVIARTLAKSGGHVILACRDVAKGEAVAADLGERAEVRGLDLADLASVREFADSVESVDVLINNAGVMMVPPRRTVDGFEMQIGVNHLGHFALTGLLIDKVRARVVTQSSAAHLAGAIDLDDLTWERRKYRRIRAYGQSKLANLLFAYELQRRLAAAGSAVLSVAVHPGYAATNLQSHTETVLDKVMAVGNRLVAQSAEMGALPALYAATAPDVEPGGYYGPKGMGGIRGNPERCESSPASRDEEVAARLWSLSEQLTGVSFLDRATA